MTHLLKEYGAVAVVLHFTIFLAVLFGFWAAIRFGWRPESVAGGVGTFTAAYIATKLTSPLRIGMTILLAPLVAKLWERVRKVNPRNPDEPRAIPPAAAP